MIPKPNVDFRDHALRRYPLASRGEVRAQDELALETARLETAVRLGDIIEGDPLGHARTDRATCQQAEQALQVLVEPGGMSRPHHVDRVEAGTLAARQPLPKIQARDPHHDAEHAALRLHARRVTDGAEQAAALERRERTAIAFLADAVENDVEPAR